MIFYKPKKLKYAQTSSQNLKNGISIFYIM